jgi:uncharacterized protein with HEPN domain
LSQRSDLDRVADMRAAVADIRELTASDRDTLDSDRFAQQAVAYNLAVLGEAARALSREMRDRYPDVPWRDVIAQRNVVVHQYHNLDVENLWTTATKDIPRLDDLLAAIELEEQDRS